MMLQQTQVDRVLPKYHEWLDKYPSFAALAAAPEADVSATWRPLGYNIRPKRLHSIAREAMTSYGGALPADRETLLSFKGIGEYTAGAILSFAFRQRAAILDTNVARVLYRVFVGRGDAKAHAMTRRLWALSAALVPRARAFDFNQALMDFGAMACSARKPSCPACPMAPFCRSYPWIDPRVRAPRQRSAAGRPAKAARVVAGSIRPTATAAPIAKAKKTTAHSRRAAMATFRHKPRAGPATSRPLPPSRGSSPAATPVPGAAPLP